VPDERPPEDPFAGLGGGEEPEPDSEEAGRRRRKAIGDALAERDRVAPEPVDRRPEVPRPGNKYAWAVGIVMLMGIAVLLLTTAIPNSGEGLRGPEPGEKLRPFAAPSPFGNFDDDATPNVCQREPCSDDLPPACEVRAEHVVNLCELRERPLVLTFIFDRGADCYPQVDRVERVLPEFPEVNFATIYFSNKGYEELRDIVEGRRWKAPVGIDRGEIVNLYGVGGCPITVFAKRGGIVSETALANLTEDELREKTRRLLRG
jgi:hypothetical protein